MENKTLELTQKELELLNYSIQYNIDDLKNSIEAATNESDKKELESEKEVSVSILNKIKKLMKEGK